ncbi:putative integrase (plasmid) [Aromatoleum aromaticum EbN1]|uniref:Integrase n=1 Tax=Aromatoleum aromaticum (strain DSM 19018 / LMG 30748 / EbN1) TaxID=76114 RepID=Q5NWA5_AROAE|nr:putative integrase [Aromatoleum aromaticum EbN1]
MGANAGTRTLTRAETDIEAVSGWLAKYVDNRNTFEAYKRDVERLLTWAGTRGKGLADLMVEDLTDYGLFLRDPQPIEDWCLVKLPRYLEDGTDNPKWRSVQRPPRFLADGSPNPEWRPFVGALSSSAAGQSLTVLFGMFEHLCGVGYLAGNPLRAARKKGYKPRRTTVDRYLEQDLWQLVLSHLETWPRETARDEAHYQRTRFLAGFLKLTALRRFEMAKASTADVTRIEGRWWLKVVGKGSVDQPIPLTREAMRLLGAYRASTRRPPLPSPNVVEPLLMDITGTGRAVSVKTIHAILKKLFLSAVQACTDPYHAEKLKAASAHWLRHTAATHLLQDGASLLHTRDALRHASVQTTEIYISTNQRAFHEDMEARQRLTSADQLAADSETKLPTTNANVASKPADLD